MCWFSFRHHDDDVLRKGVCMGSGIGLGGGGDGRGKQRLGPHDNGVKSIVTVGASFASLCDLM